MTTNSSGNSTVAKGLPHCSDGGLATPPLGAAGTFKSRVGAATGFVCRCQCIHAHSQIYQTWKQEANSVAVKGGEQSSWKASASTSEQNSEFLSDAETNKLYQKSVLPSPLGYYDC